MKKIIQLVGIISATALLAACSTTGGGGSGGGSSGGGTGNPTSFSNPSSALSAYAGSPSATTFDPATTNSAAAAMEQEGGTAAFGVGSASAGAAAAAAASSGTGVFKIGNIEIDRRTGNSLTLTIDGKPRTLAFAGTAPAAEFYGYAWDKNPGPGESVALISLPYKGEASYVSLALHVNGAEWRKDKIYTSDEEFYEIYTALSAADYNALVAGVLTPSNNMPTTSSATYNGSWILASGHSREDFISDGGHFFVTADFEKGALGGTAGYWSPTEGGDIYVPTSTLSGEIAGNGFTGTAARRTGAGFSGDLMGGFYGPQAQQIAGTGRGSVGTSSNEALVVFGGSR